MNKWSYLPLSVMLAACSGDGGFSRFDEAAANVEGIYKVSSYTRNDQACTPDGGVSQLGDDTFALAVTQSFAGQHVLTVVSCASSEDCRAKLADIRSNQGYPIEFEFTVSNITSDDLLTGAGVSTGFSNNGTCTGGELSTTRLELVGTRLHIEQAITIADDYPADGGFCTTEAARKNAEGNACSEMEVLTAELFEVL